MKTKRTATKSPIASSDLATFQTLADGTLEVTLQRLGAVRVRLPNSAQCLRISVERDGRRDFRCFVGSQVNGEERQIAAARKANGGVTPEIVHMLLQDGSLQPQTKDHQNQNQNQNQ